MTNLCHALAVESDGFRKIQYLWSFVLFYGDKVTDSDCKLLLLQFPGRFSLSIDVVLCNNTLLWKLL